LLRKPFFSDPADPAKDASNLIRLLQPGIEVALDPAKLEIPQSQEPGSSPA
jgi:hypothetical protein